MARFVFVSRLIILMGEVGFTLVSFHTMSFIVLTLDLFLCPTHVKVEFALMSRRRICFSVLPNSSYEKPDLL